MINLQQKLVQLAQSIVDNADDLDLKSVLHNIEELHKLAVVYEFMSEQNQGGDNWLKHLQQISDRLDLQDQPAPQTEEPHEVAPLIETIKNMIPEMPEENPPMKSLFEGVSPEPVFVKKESPTQTIASDTKAPPNLNDSYHKKTGVGLNDRLAFINQLFQGNTSDFNRVISQISTMDNWTSVENYLNEFIRPEYPHWADKKDIEQRFIEHLKKNFTP